MNRRVFLSAAAMGFPVAAANRVQVTRLFRSPDGHPNAIEATPEGLWIGEQTTDRAYLLDYKTGKVLKKVDTESSNTSGIAYGGGFLWMAANGKAIGRPAKPTDAKSGEIVKVDPDNGRTVQRYPMPDGGGVHGLLYHDGSLWVTCLKSKQLCVIDPKSFQVKRHVPLNLNRAHGLAWDPPGIWVVFSTDYVIQKVNVENGKVLDEIQLAKGTDPDPHGMDMYQGKMYYCDAGIAPAGVSNESPSAGYVCLITRG